MQKLHMTLKGLSDLLMNNPSSMKIPEERKITKGKDIPTSKEEARASRYVLPDGNFYIKAVAIRSSMLSGAKGFRVKKLSAKTILSGAVLLDKEKFSLLRNGKPIDGEDYVVDIQKVNVQKQGVLRSRARIKLPWEVECVFEYDEELIDLDAVKQITNNAGKVVGIGDYRVENEGWFGRFEVKEMQAE